MKPIIALTCRIHDFDGQDRVYNNRFYFEAFQAAGAIPIIVPMMKQDEIERIADSFDGVDKSFAIQAGREVRIIVKPDKINDDQMTILARDVAKKVENEMDYPGQIKVNVIRETRIVDYAK